MRKLFILLFSLMLFPLAHAADTANIKIKIAGAIHDNRYFLCIPNVGCLSILGASKGKIYSFMRPIEMNTIYITNTVNRRVYNQGSPTSCRNTIGPNQTITIQGTLTENSNNGIRVNQLHCSIN